MMEPTNYFDVPCFAMADHECSDPFEICRSLIASSFGNMGRCVMLFRSPVLAEDAGRSLGHDVVIEIGSTSLLLLILDAEKGRGSQHVAVDLVRTRDGQTACHFCAIDEMLANIRAAG